MSTLSVLTPFDSEAVVTTSSTHGHHRPYGGDVACDMDVLVASRGVPVFLELACDGPAVRAVVESVRPACRSRQLEDGGLAVRLNLQRREGEAEQWVETGLRLLYGHLDPVDVAAGDVLAEGRVRLGAMGPAAAQHWPNGRCGVAHGADDPRREEYHSSCAVHSHVHLEGFGANTVAARGTRVEPGASVVTFTIAGVPPAGRPVPEMDRVATDAASAAILSTTYVVQPGDRLVEIAARLGVALSALVEANPDLLTPGQVLNIPGVTYEVRPRDTLGEIALRFGVSVEALAAANAIADVNVIREGQVLSIPR